MLQILVNFIQTMFNLSVSNVRENMFAFMNTNANTDYFENINFNHSRVAPNYILKSACLSKIMCKK